MVVRRAWAGIGLLVVVCTLGSSCEELDPTEKHESYWVTTDGYTIIDIYSYGGENVYWHTQQLCDWLDWRIAEWKAYRLSTHPPEVVHAAPAKCWFYLYDDWIVEYPEWAHGSIIYGHRTHQVFVSIYSIAQASSPHPQSPWWTRRQSPTTGIWWYGALLPCSDGVVRGLDVVGHELDHAIGISHP